MRQDLGSEFARKREWERYGNLERERENIEREREIYGNWEKEICELREGEREREDVEKGGMKESALSDLCWSLQK